MVGRTAEFVRPIDLTDFNQAEYDAQYLFRGESCNIFVSRVPPHGFGPAQHTHPCDQIYYILSGEMHVQLGDTVHVAGANTVVLIPEGVPHHNWNDGDVEEIHLEVMAPLAPPRVPISSPTDSIDTGGRTTYVLPLDPNGFGVPDDVASRLSPEELEMMMKSFIIQRLADRAAHGSQNIVLYVGDVFPGGFTPGTHIHGFDQFYWVLEGRLHVEVGFDQFVAEPNTLVVLPAGVPHRQWNEGPEKERHIVFIVPEPPEGVQWDVPVSFSQRVER